VEKSKKPQDLQGGLESFNCLLIFELQLTITFLDVKSWLVSCLFVYFFNTLARFAPLFDFTGFFEFNYKVHISGYHVGYRTIGTLKKNLGDEAFRRSYRWLR
jgi:hypothetical protein